MTFFKLQHQLETVVFINHAFELVELHYQGFAFGSGTLVYKANGQYIALIYNGRDDEIEVFISKLHEKYPDITRNLVWSGLTAEFYAFKLNII